MSFYPRSKDLEEAISNVYVQRFKKELSDKLHDISEEMIYDAVEEAARHIKARVESARNVMHNTEEHRLFIFVNNEPKDT